MLERDDLKIDVYRTSGPRGEDDRVVRVTHLPTGVQAVSAGAPTADEDIATAIAEIEAKLSTN